MFIGAGIYGLYRGNNLVGMMRGLQPLQFVTLYQGILLGLAKLEPYIRTWWGKSFISLSPKGWFEHKRDNLLWAPHTDASEKKLELLLESRLQRPYKSHLMVVPRLMIF